MARTTKNPAIRPDGQENLNTISIEFRFQGYIEGVENRGITLDQLQRVVAFCMRNSHAWREKLKKGSIPAPTYDGLNFHDVKKWLIEPGTAERNCALVEMLTSEQQAPIWFVCYTTAMPLATFLKAVQLHTRVRDTPQNAPMWVCSFAVREHAPEDVFGGRFDQSGYFKLLQGSHGMLLILGESEDANPFLRTWCLFDISVAVSTKQNRGTVVLMDVAINHASKMELLTSGMTSMEREQEEKTPGSGNWAKECREKKFPLHSLHSGLALEFEKTSASNEDDYGKILMHVAGMPAGGTPLNEHPNYEATSKQVRAELALAAWRKALLLGHGGVESLRLPEVLRADTGRKVLVLDYLACDEMVDHELVTLARGLPPNLSKLELSFVRCALIGNRGVQALGAALPSKLISLLLDFSSCGDIGDAGVVALVRNLSPSLESLQLRFKSVKGSISDKSVVALGAALPEGLHTLELDFARSGNIGNKSIEALSENMPPFLRSLHLDFWMCGEIDDDGFHELAVKLPKTLETLQLRFTGARGNITDKSVTTLSTRLPDTLQILKLDFQYFDQLGDAGLDALGQHMPSSLHTLELKVEGCDKIGDAGISWLFEKMPVGLQTLLVHFEFCNQITSQGVSNLAERLPGITALRALTLNFGCCGEIKDQGLVRLAENVPTTLEKLHLDFKYCKKVGDMGLAALGKALPPSLLHLSLHFGFCELIYDAGICEFAKGLPESLEVAEINFWRCKNVGDTGIMHIAKSLPASIRNLQLTVDGTKVSPAKRAYCTGVESIRRCKPTNQDLFAPLAQPHRTFANTSRIHWLTRHGPHLDGVDELLADEPVLQPLNSPLFGKLAKTGMTRSQSSPSGLARKSPPAALKKYLPKV